jgi:DNA sulfur modification protein DndD
MKIHSISLTNFRQFAGQQSFDLQTDSLKPVCLIFGANGAGKTTLLNAFTWALHGTMSEDVEEQGRMVTDTVWRATPMGQGVELAVELLFDHEGHRYRVRRRAKLTKQSDEQPKPAAELDVWRIGTDGSSEAVRAPQPVVDSILPENLSRFLFFNGERIEKLIKKNSYTEVRADIKALLGLEHVERAIEHLPKVDKRLSQDVRKYGGEKANAIQSAIDELRDREESERNDLSVLDGRLAELTEEQEGVLDLLRQNEHVAPIQAERERTASDLVEARTQRDEAVRNRASLVATRGFLAFTQDLARTTDKTAEALYQRGALPAPLKREFVEKLLTEGTCICGTPLTEHSAARHSVEEWRQRAGLQEVEAAWQQLRGKSGELQAARLQLREELESAVSRVTAADERVAKLVERMSELDGLLKNIRREEVQGLEAKRKDLADRSRKVQEDIGALRARLEETRKQIEKKNAERGNAEVTDVLAVKARERSELVESVRRALQEILEIRTQNMRGQLERKLKDTFGKIVIKPYEPRLSETFELGLYQDIDGVEVPVGKSTGENQILSLSFVAAVSELARESRRQRPAEGDLAEDVGTYPIVMDAAFGSLDTNYQRDISRALVGMAPQLIVLVSKSQGLGQVVQELKSYTSHLGVIVTHTTRTDREAEDIVLDDTSHPFVRPGAPANYTELKEIK